jgi:hypothetical protein
LSPGLYPGTIFSRPWRDWIVLVEATQHFMLGYTQPSLRDLVCKWVSGGQSHHQVLLRKEILNQAWVALVFGLRERAYSNATSMKREPMAASPITRRMETVYLPALGL